MSVNSKSAPRTRTLEEIEKEMLQHKDASYFCAEVIHDLRDYARVLEAHVKELEKEVAAELEVRKALICDHDRMEARGKELEVAQSIIIEAAETWFIALNQMACLVSAGKESIDTLIEAASEYAQLFNDGATAVILEYHPPSQEQAKEGTDN